jgi:hypothetical protein
MATALDSDTTVVKHDLALQHKFHLGRVPYLPQIRPANGLEGSAYMRRPIRPAR